MALQDFPVGRESSGFLSNPAMGGPVRLSMPFGMPRPFRAKMKLIVRVDFPPFAAKKKPPIRNLAASGEGVHLMTGAYCSYKSIS